MGLDTVSGFTVDRRHGPAEAYLAPGAMLPQSLASQSLASQSLLPMTLPNFRGANIQAAAAHNRRIILQSLRVLKTAERSDLAEITGLTAPAVSKIVKDLLRDKLVISPSTRQGAKGQPAAVLAVNPDAAFSVGVGIEPDHMTLAVVDFAGAVRGHRRLAGAQPDMAALRRFLGEGLGDPAFDTSKIAGVGIAVGPSPDGRVEIVEPELARLFGGSVRIEDRVIAAAHAETALGPVSGADPFFHLHLADRLSGALVVDRQVMRGSLNRHGDPAALPQLNPFRSSRTDLAKTLGDAISLPALLRFLAERGLSVAGPDEIDLSDTAVDEAVGEWIDAVADLLYVPLLSMFCCLNLGSVRIGGSLPPAIVQRLCASLSNRLSLNLGRNWPEMAVRPSVLGGLASAAGAALLAFDDRWDLGR